VSGGQFDLLIPGGGTGIFDACTSQWNINDQSILGPDYGGFLTACKQQTGSSNNSTLKSCVQSRCDSVFSSWSDLKAGCDWFVDWLHVADNPSLTYREVECPQAIINVSGMDRRPLDDISNTCN
jgi:hypothetical protein